MEDAGHSKWGCAWCLAHCGTDIGDDSSILLVDMKVLYAGIKTSIDSIDID